MATLETSEITVHNLKPSTKYTVCLSVRTTGGTTTSNPQTVQTLAVNKLTSNDSYIIVLGIVGSVIFISVAVLLFCKVRMTWKQPIEFDLPKIVPNTYNKVFQYQMFLVDIRKDLLPKIVVYHQMIFQDRIHPFLMYEIMI